MGGDGGERVTHQRLAVLFRGATDTGGDVMVLMPTDCLWPPGSLAWGRMLAIQFKFRHTSGGSTTAGATLAQNTRESRREECVTFSMRKWTVGAKRKKEKIPARGLARGLSDRMTLVICL